MIHRLPSISTPSLILVVDDEPKNVQVAGALLLQHGHEIIGAHSGLEALEKLKSFRPDLILLDVMMPGMSGFDLCKHLREDPENQSIPVIFLSAATDKNFVVEALDVGGVDYVTKPFHGPELISRINLHLNLQKTRRELTDAITGKNRLLEVVAHDLKNPLSGIQFAATMMKEAGDKLPVANYHELVRSIADSTERAFEIISGLLETTGLDEAKSRIFSEPVCLKETTGKALKGFEQHFKRKSISFEIRHSDDRILVMGAADPLLCCLENLISNAIKFSPSGTHVIVQVEQAEGSGRFKIHDQGPGIQETEKDGLFTKFSRLSARPTAGEGSTGLGLHIVHELISAMNGTVYYEASPLLEGASFTLKLPIAK